MTYALLLAFFRNDMGFGGNNGLTDFKDILGFDVQAQAHARWRCSSSPCARAGARLYALRGDRDLQARQGADRHPRRRKPHALPRLPGRELQALRLRRLGLLAGVAGALYVPQVGIINPSEFAPGQLHRGGDLGRRRRPRHADRRRSLGACSSTSARRTSPPAPSRPIGCLCSAACSSSSRCSAEGHRRH